MTVVPPVGPLEDDVGPRRIQRHCVRHPRHLIREVESRAILLQLRGMDEGDAGWSVGDLVEAVKVRIPGVKVCSSVGDDGFRSIRFLSHNYVLVDTEADFRVSVNAEGMVADPKEGPRMNAYADLIAYKLKHPKVPNASRDRSYWEVLPPPPGAE